MRPLTVKLPDPLWRALEQRRAEHGEPIEHIVRSALADYLHAVTDDRRAGGHVLDCRFGAAQTQLQQLSDLRVALPATAEFLCADLTRDPSADLARAERRRD